MSGEFTGCTDCFDTRRLQDGGTCPTCEASTSEEAAPLFTVVNLGREMSAWTFQVVTPLGYGLSPLWASEKDAQEVADAHNELFAAKSVE